MSKSGKKLIAAAEEALAIVKGERSDFKVTHGSGCIFCDIGLKPTRLKRQWVHHIPKEGKTIVCPLKGMKLSSEADAS